ncbi:MAG: Mur ligase family protein [Pirellulales bacterium]
MTSPLRAVTDHARNTIRAIRRARRERRAALCRTRLGAAPVIAVTGSASKTTTVKLLAHLLGGPPRVGVSLFANTARDVLSQFATVGPDTSAVVVEASEFPVGNLERTASSLRPTVAVLTISGLDHYTQFRGAAGAAREMATLARLVPADGLVVVNADDEHLRSAVTDVGGAVVTFGLHADAEYRAVECVEGHDHRLVVLCRHGADTVRLETPFLGRHFHVTTLAAVATAHRLGIPWPEIQSRLASFEPVFGRCSLLAIPDGPLFICDTIKSPAWSIQSSIETLDLFADAPRRTFILGTISDYPGSSRITYRRAWRHANLRVDRAIFLRHSPSHVGASAADVENGRTIFLQSVERITSLVESTAIPGEVILLKGSSLADHLDRIAHDFLAPVACWRDKCGRNMNCINCEWMRDRTPSALRPLRRLQHKLSGRRRIHG